MSLFLILDANWVKKLGDNFLKKNGRLVSVDVQHLVSYAQSYWSSELLSVGLDVLRNLDALYKFSNNKAFSEVFQIKSLLHIYEVSKFLLKSNRFSHGHGNLKTLETFYRQPIECLFRHAVPLDGKKSLEKEMVYQRITEHWQDIMKELIYENTKQKGTLTYGLIGRVVVMMLGTANVKDELFVQIMTKFEANKPWKDFIQSLRLYSGKKIVPSNKTILETCCMVKLYEALLNTCSVNWIAEIDYVTPGSFMYLVERLLLFTSCLKGSIYATKSSFTEWLICQNENSLTNLSFMVVQGKDMRDVHDFVANTLNEFVCDQHSTQTWIKKSNLNVKHYFPSLLLRLVVYIYLLHLISDSGKYLQLLRSLLRKKYITTHFPLEFCNVLLKGKKKHMGLKVFAEAFKVIGNPLVIAKFRKTSSQIACPDAVFVDLTTCRKRELILETLFPSIVESVSGETAIVTDETSTYVSDQALDGKIKDGQSNVESDPSQANTAVGNDDQHGKSFLKESKDNATDNSQDAVNSGPGKAKENNKQKKKIQNW